MSDKTIVAYKLDNKESQCILKNIPELQGVFLQTIAEFASSELGEDYTTNQITQLGIVLGTRIGR